MTKKSGTTVTAGGTDSTQEKMNELYTAHQVHTLAQLIFQQIAARRTGGPPWTPAVGSGMPSSMNGRSFTTGWPGSVQGAPQPLIYWYP